MKNHQSFLFNSLIWEMISVEDNCYYLDWVNSIFSCAHFEGQTNELFMQVFAQSCLMMACVGPMLWVLLLSRNNTPQRHLKYSWPGRPITLSHCGFLITPSSSSRFSPPCHCLPRAPSSNLLASGCASHSRPVWSLKCHNVRIVICHCCIFQFFSWLRSSAYMVAFTAFISIRFYLKSTKAC